MTFFKGAMTSLIVGVFITTLIHPVLGAITAATTVHMLWISLVKVEDDD